MIRVGGHHERFGLDGQQVVPAHQPGHAFVVQNVAAPPKFGADPSVAGTLEKIYLQRLVSQQALGRRQLDAKVSFLDIFGWSVAVVFCLQLVLPTVQHPPMHAKLFGQRDDVVAALQPLYRLLLEFQRISPHGSLLCHSQCLSLPSVTFDCLSFWVQSIASCTL